jgi:hypothetical protein
VTNDENQRLIDELRARMAVRAAEGETDPEWLDEQVGIVTTRDIGPVDRFLQTPPEPSIVRRVASEARRRPIPGYEPGVADARLREAITWLKLSLDTERGSRERLSARAAQLAIELSAIDRRLTSAEISLRALGYALGERIHRLEDDRRWTASLLARERYAGIAAAGIADRLDLEGVELRVFSQNGEDGIIMHLFSRIGVTDRRFVEIGVEDGRECNTANLAINLGWSGLMLDRDEDGVAGARRRFAARPQTAATLRVEQAHITRENIDAILAANGVEGELDLLSIDIDGNDLWVWEAVASVRPRIVVMEYNGTFGPDRSVSVPYDPGFDRMARHPSGWYHGASVTALTRVGSRKGYVLAGCDSNGVNAFFIREDCAAGVISPVDPAAAWRPVRERGPASTDEQFAKIADLPLEEVS